MRIASPYTLTPAEASSTRVLAELQAPRVRDLRHAPPCTCQPRGSRAGRRPAEAARGPGMTRLRAPGIPEPDHARGHHRCHVTDNQITSAIDDELAGKNLALRLHYLDSRYLSAALVVSSTPGTASRYRAAAGRQLRADPRRDLLRPRRLHRRLHARTVTCPQGSTAAPGYRSPSTARTRSWPPSPPPLRSLPGPRPVHHRQATAAVAPAPRPGRSPGSRPAAETTTGFQADYARRASIESTIHQTAARRTTRPLPAPAENPPRSHLHGLRAQPSPAVGLLDPHPSGPTATSHLARLELSLAA